MKLNDFELNEQYSQFFGKYNWIDFTFVSFDIEKISNEKIFIFEVYLLGLGLSITLQY